MALKARVHFLFDIRGGVAEADVRSAELPVKGSTSVNWERVIEFVPSEPFRWNAPKAKELF